MKKVCLVCVLLVLTLWGAQAQNRQIRFEESRDWSELQEKAKKENKMIFVDFYTSWCGPCKMLVDSVFSRDEVADYFNKNFICAHFDVEKDKDGKALFQKHKMQAVPTLGFFAPATGELLHMAVGANDKNWLMEQVKLAEDPQNSFGAMAKRFKNGERDEAFVEKYLEMLNRDQKKEIVSEYLSDLPVKQFVSIKNWEMLASNIRNPLSKAFKRLISEREKFYDLIGEEIVDDYLSSVINGTIDALTGTLLGGQLTGEEGGNLGDLVNYLKSIDYAAASGALVSVKMAEYRQKGDFAGMLNYMQEAVKAKLFRNGETRQFIVDNIGALALCSDATIINKGIEWLDDELKSADDYLYQANLSHMKSTLFEKMGKTDLAKQAKRMENAYLYKAKKRSGGQIMRIFKSYGNNPRK